MSSVKEVAQIGESLKMYADSLGIELYGVAAASDYLDRFPQKPQPTRFVNEAKSIIVIGLPLEPSTVATVLKPELTDFWNADDFSGEKSERRACSGAKATWFLQEEKLTIYRELDLYAYRITKWLRKRNWNAFHNPVNKKDDTSTRAPFYHQPAMFLAGLGTWGLNCCIITPEFGPRIYVTTIITDCPLPSGKPLEKDLCTKCGLCVKNCPSNSIDGKGWKNPYACLGYGCCDTCIAVCPVGKIKVPRL